MEQYYVLGSTLDTHLLRVGQRKNGFVRNCTINQLFQCFVQNAKRQKLYRFRAECKNVLDLPSDWIDFNQRTEWFAQGRESISLNQFNETVNEWMNRPKHPLLCTLEGLEKKQLHNVSKWMSHHKRANILVITSRARKLPAQKGRHL